VLPQPLLAVGDVPASARWYAELLGAEAGHGGDEYEQLRVDGAMVLQLHDLAVDHHHGPIGAPAGPRGGGVAIWFAVGAFDDAVARSRALGAVVQTDVHVNPNAGQRELWLRDPVAYLGVLADADASGPHDG
jgi:catechol 2,3-dioxygenase-like lactoylglutathione lyase family enzyme